MKVRAHDFFSLENIMPTYVCWTKAGRLSPGQRERIAKAITEIHHEEAWAPRYFVQVIFSEIGAQSHFVGGIEATRDQIWVRADIRSGRTEDQKGKILTRIASEISEIAEATRESVWVYVSDIPSHGVLEFGHILPPLGEEDSWFAKLPIELQERLRPLA